MKSTTAIILSTLVSVALSIAARADQEPDGSPRWGIVTKKPVAGEETPPADARQPNVDTESAEPDTSSENSESTHQGPAIPTKGHPDTDNDNRKSEATAEGVEREPSQVTPPAKKTGAAPSSNKTKSKNQNPSAPSKTPIQTPTAIKWDSEAQKATCDGYLKQLQDLFLRTRHYSIQGVPCETADHADAFLQVANKCEKECPKGLLEKSGYTSRIMRNINWLNKLGNDKCSDNLPAIKKDSESKSAAPLPKN
jgi:hypothetical protein